MLVIFDGQKTKREWMGSGKKLNRREREKEEEEKRKKEKLIIKGNGPKSEK